MQKINLASRGLFKKGFGFLFILQFSASLFAQRIVSLAPGLTEIVFALGQGGSLVGVTRFCDFPAAAKDIKKVGGFLDINREALAALDPDIVLTYPEHADKVGFLRQKVLIVTVRHERLSELLQSILKIGQALQVKGRAKDLVASIHGKMQALSLRSNGKKKIRTLLIVGRNVGDLRSMYVIGKKDFLNDLLEIAGGTNAYNGKIDYPNISLESVIDLAPEFIFEISTYQENISEERILAFWRPYGMIPAVAKSQIRIIKDSFWLRPGPRVGMIAEELAKFFGNGSGHD